MENLFFQKNPLQDLLSSLNAVISTNESIQFTPGHMVYNLAYTSILPTDDNHHYVLIKIVKILNETFFFRLFPFLREFPAYRC